jgi:HAE1 family hydrophobic/amphiphilic exporter-1
MTDQIPHRDARLPRFSLDRRITIVVLLAAALVVGAVAAISIPVELFPHGFTAPFLTVYIPWRHAPPREVLEKISEPLEEELGTVRGIDRITSVAQTGRARCFLQFKQGTDMDLAYREVRDRIERARRGFPSDVDRVYTFKHDASGIPVFVMGVAVDTSLTDYYNLIQKQIVLPIERADGVASVEVNGLEEKEILIELDRDRTHASGLNIYELAQDLGADNFSMASGHVRDGSKKLLLRSVARYSSLDEIENRLVAPPSLRLKDIATIRYAEADKRYRVRAMSKPAYAVIVFKEGQANTREVSKRVREVVEEYGNDPRLAGVETAIFFDQGEVIEESLATLLKSGAIGGIIAACVLFFFLRRFRVMMVVTLAIPLSLVIALTVMFFAGESLNILSLLSLMVCVGLLVDNSVVVAENIDRLHRQGTPRREAAISGAGEIALAITMSTLTTVVVFLPVSLVEGPGQFFLLRMAIPICVSLVASLIVALICIPLGVYLTLPRAGQPGGRGTSFGRVTRALARSYDATFGRLNHRYNAILAHSLRRRLDLVLLLVFLFAVTIGVTMKRITFVEVQQNEEAGFEIDVEMPQEYTLEETEAWFLEAESIVESHAEELDLEGWFHFHRKTYGEIQGWFKNPRTNDLSPQKVTERVVELLPQRPGIELTTGEESQVDEEEGQSIYRVTLFGEDPVLLDEVAGGLEEIFERVDGVLGVRRDSEQTPNELALVVDRRGTQRYGVNPRAVAGIVGYALRGQALPKHRDEGREIPVRVRFKEEDRESLTDLANFFVPTQTGGILPLSAVTDVRMLNTPETIVRRNKRIARTIAFDLKKGEEEKSRERLETLMRAIDLPEGITFSDQTDRRQLDEDLAGLMFALALSVVFIYLLMGLLFESFILPLSIILTIPLASLGVLWIHILLNLDIDFLGAVGIVLLVGVVVNNGIVLIDYVNRLRHQGMTRSEAILTAADRRFRPIMMTAITTIGGMIPLAIAGRMDSGISYTSFSLTLIGGMTTATLLTLLVVPVFYTFFDDVRNAYAAALRRALLRGRRRPTESEAA